MSQVDINIEDLKKMSESIAANSSLHNAPLQTRRLPQAKPAVLHKKQIPNLPNHNNVESTSSISDDIDKIIGANGKVENNLKNDNFLSVAGLNVPKQTFYLALVLILIAIAIWYMSKDKSKKKKKQSDEEEE